MKKIKIIILISIIIYAIFVNFNNVYAVGIVSLTSNKSKCTIDDEFIINVNISNMSCASLTVKINIDTTKVEYISGPQNSNFVNGRIIYTWTDPSGGLSPKESGTIASFKFKAKIAGTASFSVIGDFYDQDENSINPSFSGTNVVLEAKQVVNSQETGGNNSGNGETIENNNHQGIEDNNGSGNSSNNVTNNLQNNQQNNKNENSGENSNNNGQSASNQEGGLNNNLNGSIENSTNQGGISSRKSK